MISWDSTRMMRFQALRSSSCSARLRSESAINLRGYPSWRTTLRRSSHRPDPPGNDNSTVRGVVPVNWLERRSSSAVLPLRRSAGCPSSLSPARLTMRSTPCGSKASTTMSISSRTLRSVSAASTAPSLCSLRISSSELISRYANETGSRASPTLALIEKSPSRRAASMFAMVSNGRSAWFFAAVLSPSHPAINASDSGHRIAGSKPLRHRKRSATTTAGRPANTVRRRTRLSCRLSSHLRLIPSPGLPCRANAINPSRIPGHLPRP